jgi:uncharacterized protein involved in cysteine biosynthesis
MSPLLFLAFSHYQLHQECVRAMCMTSGGTDVCQELWLQCIFQDGNTFAIFFPILLVMIGRFTWRCLRSSSRYRDGPAIVPGIHKWLTWSNILKCQTFCRWLSTIPPHQKDPRCSRPTKRPIITRRMGKKMANVFPSWKMHCNQSSCNVKWIWLVVLKYYGLSSVGQELLDPFKGILSYSVEFHLMQ